MLAGTILAATVLVGTNSGPASAVIGGTDVAAGAMPFAARVDVGDADRSCSGVLVHPQVVLTAAACFAGADGIAKSGTPALATTATIGRTVVTGGTGGVVSAVPQVIVHPGRDLALARLTTPVTSITPIAIASAAPQAQETLVLAGYGRTEQDWVANRLRSAEFTVSSVGTATVDVTPKGSTTVGTCMGDAGGPALRAVGSTYELAALHRSSNQARCLGSATGDPTATETRVDDVRSWVTANLPSFATGFESGDPRPNWLSTPTTGGLSNVIGVCCSLTGPELTIRAERPHGGSNVLMYSGRDNSLSSSYAYLKAFSLRSVKLRSSSVLSYWIFPQSTATSEHPFSSNSTCVAVDVVFTDGSNLRDSSATDQRGNRAHPLRQCGKLTLDAWNEVIVPIGTIGAGKQIDTLAVAYDQPATIGGYRGLIDDLRISDVVESDHFASGLESGQPALTWTSTVSIGGSGTGGNLSNVGGVCCSLTAPELAARAERPFTGTNSLMYSGRDNNLTSSYAYLKAFQLNNVFAKPTTKLSYRIFPQSTATSEHPFGSNSTCVSIDLLFVDQYDAGKTTNMRDTTELKDQKGNRAHPSHQCGKLELDKWNEVTINLGPVNGKQITQVDFGYDQGPNTGGYRGLIDDIRIFEAPTSAAQSVQVDTATSVAENFSYPNGDQVAGIRLVKGDGQIRLVGCDEGRTSAEVYSYVATKPYCFEFKGTTGYVALELEEVYGIRNYLDFPIDAKIEVDDVVKPVEVPADDWKGVGIANGEGQALLLELRA